MSGNDTNRDLRLPVAAFYNDGTEKFFAGILKFADTLRSVKQEIVQSLLHTEADNPDYFARDYFVSIGQNLNVNKASLGNISEKGIRYTDEHIERVADFVATNLFSKPTGNNFPELPAHFGVREQQLYKAVTDNIKFANSNDKNKDPKARALSTIYQDVLLHEVFAGAALGKEGSAIEDIMRAGNSANHEGHGVVIQEKTHALIREASKFMEEYGNSQMLGVISEGRMAKDIIAKHRDTIEQVREELDSVELAVELQKGGPRNNDRSAER